MSTETLPRRSRWRSFFVGSALVVAGVIVGVGTSAMSQGFGPRHGWSDDGDYDRSDRGGDRDRGFDRDRDGPRFWHRFGEGGPRGWFGRERDGGRFGGDGDGWQGRRFGRFGERFMSPGRIERMVDRLGWAVDASTEQKQKIRDILQHTADDVRPLRAKVRDDRRQIRDLLTASTIDRAKLETLRADQMKTADQASQRVTTALADAAEVLTPDQRAELARRLERFGGRRG